MRKSSVVAMYQAFDSRRLITRRLELRLNAKGFAHESHIRAR